MRTLQKTFNTQSTQQTKKFQNYSNITKLEHEHRERGFQVFISGANKERLKLQDLQGKTLQSKKTIVNNNYTLQRLNKLPIKEFAKRKIWQKSSNIEIKQSDGSKSIFSNPNPPKLDNGLSSTTLHDITSSKNIEFHSSVKNNSQLKDIRNRYKAYFHIDGHGFCHSKNLSKPTTPTGYQIDKTSLVFNRKNFKHLKRNKARPILNPCSPQPYNIEEQQSEYYSLLNKNKKCIGDLQKLSTSSNEYFQSAKESNIQNSHENVTKDVIPLDSYDGIDYDVFYHKEHIICRSAQALLLNKVLNESSFKGSDENQKKIKSNYNYETSTNKLKPHCEPCLRPTISFCKLKENKNKNNEGDKKALVLLNNCKVSDEFILENKENKENDYLPPLGMALSPTSLLVKSNSYHVIEEKESCLTNEKQCISNKEDTTLCNNVFDIELPSRSIDNEYKSALKLNLNYIHQDLNSKVHDMKKVDMLQPISCDEKSTSSNNNGSNQTIDYSTTCSSTLSNTKISPKWFDFQEHKNLKLLLEKPSKELKDVDFIVDSNNTSSIYHNKNLNVKGFSEQILPNLRRKMLNARIQQLDIKKLIYLSHILDRLEIAHVSRSVDFFCHFGLQGI